MLACDPRFSFTVSTRLSSARALALSFIRLAAMVQSFLKACNRIGRFIRHPR